MKIPPQTFTNSSSEVWDRKEDMTKSVDYLALFILFFSSLILRVVYVTFYNVNRITSGQDVLTLRDDQYSYWQFADTILRDASWLTKHISYRPPLYPMFIAFVTFFFGTGRNFVNIMLVQSLIGAFSVVLIYCIGRMIFNRQAAILSSVWTAIYPLYLYYCGFILSETLVIFLFLFFTFFFVRYIQDRRHASIICSGLAYALLIHTDPRFLFHLPFFPLFLYLGLKDWRKSLYACLLFSLVLLLCSLPWAVRNHLAYKDRFVLINTRTLDMWAKRPIKNFGIEPEVSQTGSVKIKPDMLNKFEETKKMGITFYKEQEITKKLTQFGGKDIARGMSGEEVKAFEGGTRPDFDIFHLYIHNLVELWRFARFTPGYDPYPDLRFEPAWSLHRNLIGIAFTGILYPFFAAGIFFCIRKKDNLKIMLCLILLVHTLLHVVVHSRERYRMPVEGFIFMFAFYGLLELLSVYRIDSKFAMNSLFGKIKKMYLRGPA